MAFGNEPPILRKDSTDTEFTPWKIALIVFMSIINSLMFFGNSLSIATICYTKSLRKQVSYWFVLNLAIIDLIISMTVVPLNIIWEYHGIWPLSQSACDFFTFADIAFSTISAYSIVLVSIDKYMYISYSIHYYHRMTRKVATILIVTVWVFVFIFATISVFTSVGTSEEHRDHYIALSNGTSTCIFVMTDKFVIPSAIICFFIPFAILCFTSSNIVCIARKHIRKIHGSCFETDSETSKSLKTKRRSTVFSIHSKPKEVYLTSCLPCHSNKLHNNISSPNSLQERSGSIEYDQAGVKPEGSISDVKPEGSISSPNLDLSVTNMTVIPEDLESNKHPSMENSLTTVTQSSRKQDNTDSVLRLKYDTNCKLIMEAKFRKTSTISLQLRHTDSLKSIERKRSPYCKLFGTVTIVIACFVVMFAPYYVATIVDVWCRCLEAWIYEDILAVLYYMHSFVNPYIYMATDRKYKAALKIIWVKICKR